MDTPILYVGLSMNRDTALSALDAASFTQVTVSEGGHSAVRHLLANSNCGALIIDYDILDIDVWRLARIVRSGRFCSAKIPIVLLYESSEQIMALTQASVYGLTLLEWDRVDRIGDVLTQALKEGAKPRILVIEDDPDAAEIAQCALAGHYAVEVAETAAKGLARWQAARHDLIVLDLMLPDQPGERVLEQIMMIDPHQPLIVVTAYKDIDKHANLILNGAREFLAKPIRIDQINHVCDQVYNQSVFLRSLARQDEVLSNVCHHLWAARNHCLNQGSDDVVSEHIQAALDLVPMPAVVIDEETVMANERDHLHSL